jgi:phage terminase small subunit
MNKGLIKANEKKAALKIIDSANVPEVITDQLNDKQKAFVREYCYDWRPARAYMKVYNVDNENVAKINASKLLTNANIQKYIQYCRTHVEEMVNVSKAMMLEESMKIATSNIAKYHNTWITLKEFDEIPESDKAAIQSIESETRKEMQGTIPIEVKYVKIKLYNKQISIETINKMLGYNSAEKIELSAHSNLENVPTDELIKRASAVKELPE